MPATSPGPTPGPLPMLIGMLAALGGARPRRPSAASSAGAADAAQRSGAMNGFAGTDLAGTIATWVAAIATIAVWSYLVGARRIFVLMQHLLAGLATGYLVLLAIREVLVPRLVVPLRPASARQRAAPAGRWCRWGC